MQINCRLIWYPRDCAPTDEDINEAQRKVEEIILKELNDGSFIDYPRVCYFIGTENGVETIWPQILRIKAEDSDRWRYAGTFSLDLTLLMKQEAEKLLNSFEAHKAWYENSLKKFKEKLKKHKSLLKGSHFNDKYGVSPTIGNLKEWLFRKYAPKLKLELKFQEDKKLGIIWVNDFNYDFPDITKAFEREVREEDLHIFCREIVDRQKEIEKRLDSASTQELPAGEQNKSFKKEYSARQVALFYQIVSEAFPEKYMLKDDFRNNNDKYEAITRFIQETFSLHTYTPERFERMTNEVALKKYILKDQKVVVQLLKDYGFNTLAVKFSNNF